MGRIDAVIPDEMESKLRIQITQRFGGKKGDLTKTVKEALYSWIDQSEFERRLNKFKRDCRPMERTIDDGKFMRTIGNIRFDILDIDDSYLQPINLTPKIVRECEEKLRKDFIELDNILTQEYNKKSLEEFKYTVNEIVKRANMVTRGMK